MGVPQLTLIVKVFKREDGFMIFEIKIEISHLKALRWSRKHVSACQLRGQDWIEHGVCIHTEEAECDFGNQAGQIDSLGNCFGHGEEH